MTPSWLYDAAFYHIYPLGLLDAPQRNDFFAPPISRLDLLAPWIDHIRDLNLNALYIGPVFESTAHGYDTADYFTIDRRLGTNETFKSLSADLHAHGIRVVLDAVFNHVGRDFWAFRDLQANGPSSPYASWFHGIDFTRTSPYGDPFTYEGWSGHYDLVRLNLTNPDVKQHLFDAISHWVRDYAIDGLRLDAADLLDMTFLHDLRAHCRALDPEFWLMGEIIHGDYRQWANPDTLDSVTNYECYKGLWSSLVDKNYFEIAYSLNRQFGDLDGEPGLYRDLLLYNFADNHDVNRVASNLTTPAHLYPLYLLLATMPGIPSIYYGSEWGITGERAPSSDRALRPALDLSQAAATAPQPDLPAAIRRLMAIRRDLPALRCGDYRQLHVAHEQFAFARAVDGQSVVIALNASSQPAAIPSAGLPPGPWLDHLTGETISAGSEIPLPPAWGRILTSGSNLS
jgi:glycosidase